MGDILEDLIDSRLVREERRGRELVYEIAHPLVAEAIYEGVGGARRRSLHRLVGRTLISLGRLGQAAPHFAHSAEVGDAEAIEALQGAVRQAEEREANREVIAILGALAEVLPSGDDRWLDVFESMAQRAEWVLDHRVEGDVVLGIRAMREIDAVLGRLEDPGRRAAAKLRLASFLTYGPGDVEEAERLCREAVALYEQAGDLAGARLAANELSWIAGVEGHFVAMEEGGRAVVAEAEQAGDHLATMLGLGTVAFAALFPRAVRGHGGGLPAEQRHWPRGRQDLPDQLRPRLPCLGTGGMRTPRRCI